MTNLPKPEDDQPEPRSGRRVYFVRLDRPEPGQGPHWVGKPAVAVNPTDKIDSTSESPPGSGSLQSSPNGSPTAPSPAPLTRTDSPLPLAASAQAVASPVAESARVRPSHIPAPHIPAPRLRAPHIATNQLASAPTDQATAASDLAPPPVYRVTSGDEPRESERSSAVDYAAPPVGDDPLQTHARQLVLHLKSRHRELRRRQRLLDRREAELAAQPAVVAMAVPEFDEQLAEAERQRAEARLKQREAELLELAERLRRREEDLDRERTALDQMRSEVAARNQEALEMRLACEQLWSQLASRMEAPRLIESIAQLRRKLADQFHGAAMELAQQRDEVRQLITRLDDRHKQLRRQREEVQAWVMRRHEELEIQQIQLLKKQQELDAREREQQRRHYEVQLQIAEYQRTIRQLTAQLRCKHELSQLGQ